MTDDLNQIREWHAARRKAGMPEIFVATLLAEVDKMEKRLRDVETDRDHWKGEFKLHHRCNKREWTLRDENRLLLADNDRLRGELRSAEEQVRLRY